MLIWFKKCEEQLSYEDNFNDINWSVFYRIKSLIIYF